MSNPHWSIAYWIREQPLDQFWEIQVPSDTSIEILLETIVRKSPILLSPYDPRSIRAYKVPDGTPVTLGRSMSNIIGSLSVARLGEPLHLVDTLSEIFVTPPLASQLHLILDPTTASMRVSCRVRGADPTDLLLVSSPKMENWSALLRRAKENWSSLFRDTPESLLKIYKILFNDDNELQEILTENERGELLQTCQMVGTAFNDIPFCSQQLEVVIEVPSRQLPTSVLGKRKQNYQAFHIVQRWSKRFKTELPTIAELRRIVDSPLSEDCKIPITLERFNDLVSPSSALHNFCTADDIQHLFRISDFSTVLDQVYYTVLRSPHSYGTRSSFISFWDLNVRFILELILPDGRSTRNSDEHTATGSLRPNYAFLLGNLCVFRGEEKSPASTGDPRKELAQKLAWVYDPAPYVLGYYATGPDLTLVAISPPQQGEHDPLVHNIASANLRLTNDRIKNICRMINLAGVLQSLAGLVQPPDAEFEKLERDNGTIEIAGHRIVKSYTSADRVERIGHLDRIYTLLKQRKVPHVDSLACFYKTTAVLSPRGISRPPETEVELLSAIVCVLEALEVLHKDPPILHQDIRWPNIMRRIDDPLKWFIVDWEDAAVAPAPAKRHFRRSTHSPRALVDGHGTEVDIWGVGALIVECAAPDISPELRDLGRRMQGSTAPSAQQVLDELKNMWPNIVSV